MLNTADCMHLGEDSLGPESFADGKLDDDLTFITRLLSSLFVPNVIRQEKRIVPQKGLEGMLANS